MGGKRGRHETDALTEVAGAVAGEPSPLALLHRLFDLVVDLTRASRGAMISTGPDGRARDMILLGTSGRRRRWEPASVTAEVVGALLGDMKSTRLQGLAIPSTSLGFPAHQPPVTSLVGGQVRAASRPVSPASSRRTRTARRAGTAACSTPRSSRTPRSSAT
jgi:hypothetical protein